MVKNQSLGYNDAMKFDVPDEVSRITNELEKAGFKAFLVGGCVRDLILGKTPKDWDITTDAIPEQIQELFPESFYENDFGTVGVKNEDVSDETLKVVEVTPFRTETTYSDNRHPDTVAFSKNIEDDLKRRDFTINALAYSNGELIDLYNGQKDLEKGIIKTVGSPDERFGEDALRILRAIRFSAQLNFSIDSETLISIEKHAQSLSNVSRERIRDEFTKIIMSDNPMIGILLIEKVGLLSYVAPILGEMIGVDQNKEAHKYDVWEHSLRSLQHAADKKYPLDIRLAALFHDIAKPHTKRVEKHGTTFYGHEVVGAKVTRETLTDLKYSKEIIEKVTKLVRWHMFFSDPEQITLSAVRRIITKVGEDNIWDLMNLRVCDRIGTGRPKEEPYRLRKYKSMVEEALRAPLSVTMLKVDGNSLIKELGIKPGPRIGYILHALFEDVLDNPELNNEDYLINRAEELKDISIEELEVLGRKGRERLEEEDSAILKDIKRKHKVK